MSTSVLVIDSNAAVRTIASLALQSMGFAVKTLAAPEKALEAAKQLHPTVLICASDLGKMSTASLVKQLEEALRTKLKIILLVASDKEKLPAWADALLIKPFRSEQLKTLVLGVLESPPAQTTAPTPSAAPPPNGALVRLADPLIGAAVARLVKKRGVTVQELTIDSPLPTHLPSLVIAECLNSTDAQQLKTVPQLIVISSAPLPREALAAQSVMLRVPLDEKKMEAALNRFLPPSAAEGQNPLLTLKEQASLAAKITAAILEKLLSDRLLTERRWSEAAAWAEREVLRICQEFRPRL